MDAQSKRTPMGPPVPERPVIEVERTQLSPRGPRTIKRWFSFAATIVTFGRLFGAETAQAIVEMPAVIVTDKSGLKWTYTEVGNLKVLSCCDKYRTQCFLEPYLLRIAELKVIFPETLQSGKSPYIMLLSEEAQRILGEKMREEMKSLAEADRSTSRPMFQFSMAGEDSVAMVFVLDQDDYSRIGLRPAVIADMLEKHNPPLPSWFRQGVFELFQQTAWVHNNQSRGLTEIYASPISFYWPLEESKLPKNLLVPLQDFFAAGPPPANPDPHVFNPKLTLWKFQSSLFFRYFLSQGGVARQALFEFAQRSSEGPVSEASFRQCFGRSFSEIDRELATYLPIGTHHMLKVLDTEDMVIPSFAIAPASRAQIAEVQGEWTRNEITYVKDVLRLPNLVPMYANAIRAKFENVYTAGERDPEFLAVAGLYDCDMNQDEKAMPLLAQAVDSGSVHRPTLYLQYARILLNDTLEHKPEGGLSAAQVEVFRDLLQKIRQSGQPLIETWMLALRVWNNTAVTPSSEDIKFLEDGTVCFPRRPAMMFEIALICKKAGFAANALKLVRQAGAYVSPDSKAATELMQLETELTAGTAAHPPHPNG